MDLTLPNPNKEVGQTGHTSDHNLIVTALAQVETAVTNLEANPPRIVGTVNSEEDLPVSGTAGELYFVGTEGDLWGWDTGLEVWSYVANLQGPAGSQGSSGTVVGILSTPTSVPPSGTSVGTLWWLPDTETEVPGADLTPSYVGGVGAETSTTSLTVPLNSLTTVSGDVAVLCAIANTPYDLTLSQAGWTEVTGSGKIPNAGSGPNIRLWTKTLAGGESSVSVIKDTSISGTSIRMAAALMVFRNVTIDSNQPSAYNYSSIGAATTGQAPIITPTSPSVVCGFFTEGPRTGSGAWTLTVPPDWTEGPTTGLHQSTNGGSVSVGAAYDLEVLDDTARPSSGANGAWTASRTTDGDTHLYTVGLLQATA